MTYCCTTNLATGWAHGPGCWGLDALPPEPARLVRRRPAPAPHVERFTIEPRPVPYFALPAAACPWCGCEALHSERWSAYVGCPLCTCPKSRTQVTVRRAALGGAR